MSHALALGKIYDSNCKISPDGNTPADAIWSDDGYREESVIRMHTYVQMAMQAQNLMVGNTVLTDGFDIITMMYQH